MANEAAVMERSAYVSLANDTVAVPHVCQFAVVATGRVGDGNGVCAINDIIAVAGDGVDAVDAVAQSEFLEGFIASRLEEFSYNAIGFLHPSLEQDDGTALFSKGICSSAAKDAGTDNNYIGFMV